MLSRVINDRKRPDLIMLYVLRRSFSVHTRDHDQLLHLYRVAPPQKKKRHTPLYKFTFVASPHSATQPQVHQILQVPKFNQLEIVQ